MLHLAYFVFCVYGKVEVVKSEKFQNARDENEAEMAFFGEQYEQDAFRWCL